MTSKTRNLCISCLVILVAFGSVSIFAAGGTETAAPKSTIGEGPFGKYDPPIDITTVRSEVGGGNVRYPEGDNMMDNVWTDLYRDRLGINLKFKWIVDASQLEQKVNLMIASGDLPDYFMADFIQFQQLIDSDLIQDMTSAYKNYAWGYTDSVIHEAGDEPLASATIDGKLMGVPYTGLPLEGVHVIFVRKDWRERLGLPEPKTMEDFLEISRAFTYDDPDGNGKNDTYGLQLDKALWQWALGFFNAYHSYPTAWVPDSSGKLAFGGILPETRDALQKLAELYADGQIDPDFAVKDYSKAMEGPASGKCGLLYGYFWTPLSLQPTRTNDPNAQWNSYANVSIDKEPPHPQVNLGLYGYWVARKGYEYPEAVVKMLNIWMEVFYANTKDDVYKTYVNWDDGNAVWQNATPMAYRAFKNLQGQLNNIGVLSGEMTRDQMTPEERGVHEKIERYLNGDESMWGWERIYGMEGALLPIKYYRDNDLYKLDEFYGPPTETMSEYWSTLTDKQNEIYTKIIVGSEPISAFDSFVAEWKRLAGDAITKEVNDWFESK